MTFVGMVSSAVNQMLPDAKPGHLYPLLANVSLNALRLANVYCSDSNLERMQCFPCSQCCMSSMRVTLPPAF